MVVACPQGRSVEVVCVSYDHAGEEGNQTEERMTRGDKTGGEHLRSAGQAQPCRRCMAPRQAPSRKHETFLI
jgi:hypothetical protein